ncbi:MAG TPA: hypothetical protein PK357_01395, partial [Candidatus Pacearchaeota archaeon]|nr:hypothetical protein [Candidatus Pacearchaeota archaeon]
PWIVQTVTDPEVLRKTIANQLNTYEMFKKQQTVGDLMTRYNGDLTKHLGDNFERANTELSDFAKEKYGEILRKIKEADYIIDGEEFGKSTDEQVEEAQKTKEKYQRVATTFYLLEKLKDGKFRTRVEEGVAVDALNEMYAPKDESKGEEEK